MSLATQAVLGSALALVDSWIRNNKPLEPLELQLAGSVHLMAAGAPGWPWGDTALEQTIVREHESRRQQDAVAAEAGGHI